MNTQTRPMTGSKRLVSTTRRDESETSYRSQDPVVTGTCRHCLAEMRQYIDTITNKKWAYGVCHRCASATAHGEALTRHRIMYG